VGETFACSLCANNELLPDDTTKVVTSIKVSAEMQTPSQAVPLELQSATEDDEDQASKPGHSIQKIIRFDLKEEGNHVLAVNVSYTETTRSAEIGSSAATGGRVRSFRKLYQFVAQPCLSVRTKATELPSREVDDKTLGPYGKSKLLRFALEAQLENVAETAITLEQTSLDVHAPFQSKSLNWDMPVEGQPLERPMLNPRDVLQIAYLVEQQQDVTQGLDTMRASMKRDGRATLGQLSIEWRGPMGERGFLTTGNLLTRRIAA
jgi:trafficking protein particle complex subunit 13